MVSAERALRATRLVVLSSFRGLGSVRIEGRAPMYMGRAEKAGNTGSKRIGSMRIRPALLEAGDTAGKGRTRRAQGTNGAGHKERRAQRAPKGGGRARRPPPLTHPDRRPLSARAGARCAG